MIFLSIDPDNYNKHVSDKNSKTAKTAKMGKMGKMTMTPIKMLNDYIKNGKHIFLLSYMEGCGPCNATRPEWKKIQNVLEEKYKHKYNDIAVVDIDHELLKHLSLQISPAGFPSMKYISNKGKQEEDYEESDVETKNRSVDSFIEWIEMIIKKKHIQSFSNKMHGGFKARTKRRSRRSIRSRRRKHKM